MADLGAFVGEPAAGYGGGPYYGLLVTAAVAYVGDGTLRWRQQAAHADGQVQVTP